MKATLWLAWLALLAPCLWSDNNDSCERLQCQIEQIQQEIYSWNLIYQLRLTPVQLRQMLNITAQAAQKLQKYRQQQSELLEQFSKYLLLYSAEAAANKAFTPELERQVGHLSHREKTMRKHFCQVVNELEAQVKMILTPGQLRDVENYRPRLASRDHHPAQRRLMVLFQRLRSMSDYQFEKKARHIAQRLWQQLAKKRRRPRQMPPEQQQRMIAALRQLRAMSPEQFQRDADQFVQKFISGNTVMQARKQLKQLHKQAYGDVSNIGRYLLPPHCLPYYRKLLASSGRN